MLLNAPAVDATLSHERTLTILDSKFSSIDAALELADFAERSRNVRDELQERLDESSIELEVFTRDGLTKARSFLATAKETALSRYVLTDDIVSLQEELVSIASTSEGGQSKRTLLEDLESLHEKLEQLEAARTYVRVVEHAVKLSEAAFSEFEAAKSSTSSFADTSLKGYVALHDLVVSVSESTHDFSANGTNLSLVDFLIGLRSRTWREIKNILSVHLLHAAERIKWPMRIEWHSYPSAERRDFENTFSNLVKLQEFGDRIHSQSANEDTESKPGLYPLQALIQPIAARFKFHFEGARPTNRLDKPEWYFTHMLNAIHEHKHFLETTIQPLILASYGYKSLNVVREFTYLLLPILSRKLRRTVPTLLSHPALLAHTVYQALIFDGTLRDEGFTLEGTSAPNIDPKAVEWEGISATILGRQDWFEAWLEGERIFAEQIYNDIINSPDAWKLVDDDSTLASIPDETTVVELRPTVSARRVRALIEQVTDRYIPLPDFPQRLQFLLIIQLPILASYLGRISAALDAFETLSSTFMRNVPGALAGTQVTGGGDVTRGTSGLGKLIKAFVSATWIAEAMDGWSEDVFFLELWSEINDRPALRSRVAEHPLLPPAVSGDSALFDQLIAQFRTLASRAEEMMARQVYSEVEGDLKGWLTTSWDAEPEEDDTTLPSSLLKPVSTLSSMLTLLTNTLPNAQLTSTYRRIAAHLTSHMYSRLIQQRSKGRFNSRSGRVFQMQVKVWVRVCSEAGVPRAEGSWAMLADVATLLAADNAQLLDALNDAPEGNEAWKTRSEALGMRGVLQRDEVRDVMRSRTDASRR